MIGWWTMWRKLQNSCMSYAWFLHTHTKHDDFVLCMIIHSYHQHSRTGQYRRKFSYSIPCMTQYRPYDLYEYSLEFIAKSKCMKSFLLHDRKGLFQTWLPRCTCHKMNILILLEVVEFQVTLSKPWFKGGCSLLKNSSKLKLSLDFGQYTRNFPKI